MLKLTAGQTAILITDSPAQQPFNNTEVLIVQTDEKAQFPYRCVSEKLIARFGPGGIWLPESHLKAKEA